jgi:hypothetical protein
MSAQQIDTDPFEDDEVPPVMTAAVHKASKPGAAQLMRTQKQAKHQAALAQKQELTEQAKQLAQIVNLMIAGHSLADIAAATGHSPDSMDRLLQRDMTRYVRNQPALRVYVRQFLSAKYTEMLDAVWDEATDRTHADKLDNQDRALRILKEMGRLHGAEAPVQSEVKVDAAPEAVERMVAVLAQAQGQAYDTSVFDVIPGEVVLEAAEASGLALDRAASAVGEDQPGDTDWAG